MTSINQYRVLLVEDNAGDERIIRELLYEMGYHRSQIQAVQTLAAGIDAISQNSFDAVLLDLSLPDSHGMDTFSALNSQATHLPIIILTGLGDTRVATEAVKQGAQDYLLKDELDPVPLDRAVRYAIGRKKLQLQNQVLLQDAKRYASQLEIINKASYEISATLSLSEIFAHFQNAIYQLIPRTNTVIFSRYDGERELFIPMYVHHEGEIQDVSKIEAVPLEPPGYGLQSQVVRTSQPMITNQFRTEIKERVKTSQDIQTSGNQTRSSLYAPLLAKHQVVGVVNLQSAEPDYYQDSHLGLLSVLSNTTAVALENSRLFAQKNVNLERLRSLHLVDVAITKHTEQSAILDVLLEQAKSGLGFDAGCVLLLDSVEQVFTFAKEIGFRSNALRRTRLKFGQGYAGQAAMQGQTVILESLDDQERTAFKVSPAFSDEGFVSYCAAPLIAYGQTIGVLEVFFRTQFRPDADWVSFLESMAGQAAIAIEKAETLSALKQSNEELQLAYDKTLEGWARALDFRDNETQEHTQRVTEMTLELAKLLGVDSSQIGYIRWGALLHDIGKIGIPDAILHKQGSLTQSEWAVICQHPAMAVDMLSPIEFLHPALDIPASHHEKWDGSGYPAGLRAFEIPLAARIFAVVDVWDALTSDRPYRKRWTPEKTLQHIQQLSGVHFDPDVVQAFSEMMTSRLAGVVERNKQDVLLIVVSDNTLAQYFAHHLRDPYIIAVAETGADALERLPQLNPVLILADSNLPDMDEVLFSARVQEIIPNAKIVLLSDDPQKLDTNHNYFKASAIISAPEILTNLVQIAVPKQN